MSILNEIAERTPLLHRKERELALFIVQHPKRVVRMNITDLAMHSNCSTATISRFCKNFYFKGYTDFKMKLATELAQMDSQAKVYQDITKHNPLERIISAMEANHLQSISDTTRLLDFNTLEKAIRTLQMARQIDLYGSATSGIVANDFNQKLIRIGKRSACFSDSHLMITSASNLTEEDAVLAFSYSGETIEIIDALMCAKERGATTISLTKYGANSLSRLSDIQLFASSLEEGMRRGDMASRIAQLHVTDILFMGMVSEQFDKYVPRLEKTYQLVTKYRKDKGGSFK